MSERARTGWVPLSMALLLAAIGGSATDAAAAPGDPPADRYALAGGCYALRSQALGRLVEEGAGGYRAAAGRPAQAERFRMQATDLGKYLFFGKGRDFHNRAGGANVNLLPPPTPTTSSPSPAWPT